MEEDRFFDLFPHRFDYIYAAHPEPGDSPDWQTESRHSLSDRVLRQGSYLFGVRFGPQTTYCLLDIDAGSPYHPQSNPLAIGRILAALEAIGLVSYTACRSSDSSGIHLYFPFQQAQSSWELATAVATLLENAGFKLRPGLLEIFPNPKPYIVEGKPSLFNAHRLPMQPGSYLLDREFQPIWSDRQSFVQQWQFAQSRNSIETSVLRQLLRQIKRKRYRVSGKADKFINDLNAEIELGWTGQGQTNYMLGRIAMREYIFHHVLQGGEPLEGKALIEAIVRTAQSLPGYREWCQHQHEIEKRAEEWTRCVEASHYFHYGLSKGRYKTKLDLAEPDPAEEPASSDSPNWNQRQSEAARERIRKAIADLLEKNELPAGATARFRSLTRYGIGGSSLYRHRDLWHPNFLIKELPVDQISVENAPVENIPVENAPVENSPEPPASLVDARLDRNQGASSLANPTSLLSTVDRNHPSDQASSGLRSIETELAGCNPRSDINSDIFSNRVAGQVVGTGSSSLLPFVNHQAAREQAERNRDEMYQITQIARMQRYLDSNDPILIAEALACAEADRSRSNAAQVPQPSVPPPQLEVRSSFADHASENTADLSSVLAAISIQIRRLAWTPEQTSDRLWILFGKRSRAMLDQQELLCWLDWLEKQEPDETG